MSEKHNGPYIFGGPLSGEFTLTCATKAEGTRVPFRICLKDLHQTLTYAGVLEGNPSHEVNRRSIQKAVKHAREISGPFEPHVIPPKEKAVKLRIDDSNKKIFTLPAVRCIGSFTSEYPTKPGAGDYSALTIVWFQDDWAFPIQDSIVSALRSLSWPKLAQDCDY